MDGTADKSSPSLPPPPSSSSSSARSNSGNKMSRSNTGRSTLRQQQDSLVKQTSVSLKKNTLMLKYIDFVHQQQHPDQTNDELGETNQSKKSDEFQNLMVKANDYLVSNPTVQTKTCEVITWMSPDPTKLGDSEEMTTSKKLTEGAKTYYVRGLRLWLIPQHIPKVQTLCYEDFVPGPNERITDLVNKVNNKIQKKQLKGRILSVQTIGAPLLNRRIQNNVASWNESVDVDSPYSFLLRIFFVAAIDAKKSSSSNMQNKATVTRLIGIRDIVSEATDEGYEGFEVLIAKTNSWIRDQSDVISITNMQSVIVRKNEGGCLSEMGNSCFYCMPGINNTESIEFFRILRVAFLRQATATSNSPSPSSPPSSASPAAATSATAIYPFTYETITPQLISATSGSTHVERLETMKETFAKAMAFLRSSGAELICAETVANPMQLYSDDFAALQPQNQMKEDEIQFLFTIRLYLSGQSTNSCRRSKVKVASWSQLIAGSVPSAVAVARADAACSSPRSGDDGTTPTGAVVGNGGRASHLFKLSIVTRQSKHQWLIMGIAAFTCIAIIAVISIVASNK